MQQISHFTHICCMEITYNVICLLKIPAAVEPQAKQLQDHRQLVEVKRVVIRSLSTSGVHPETHRGIQNFLSCVSGLLPAAGGKGPGSPLKEQWVHVGGSPFVPPPARPTTSPRGLGQLPSQGTGGACQGQGATGQDGAQLVVGWLLLVGWLLHWLVDWLNSFCLFLCLLVCRAFLEPGADSSLNNWRACVWS